MKTVKVFGLSTTGTTAGVALTLFSVVLLFLLLGSRPVFSAQSGERAQGQESAGGSPTSEAGKRPVDIVPVPGEKTPSVEKESLDVAGEKFGKGIDFMSRKIASVLGSWVNVKLWRGITGLKLIGCFSLLLLSILLERACSAGITAVIGRIPSESKSLLWKKLLLEAIRSPLSLIILLYGTYIALSPLFRHFQGPGGRNILYEAAGTLTDVGGTIAFIWLVYRLVRAADALMQSRINTSRRLLEILVKRCRGPIQILVMLVVIRSLMPVLGEVPHVYAVLTNFLSLVFIGTVAWFVIEAMYVASDYFEGLYSLKARNPFYLRKVHTQLQFLRRLTVTLIILVAAASSMMIFDKVRQIGTSILASAGIAGVIVGFSAQRTLANLLVGLQIAVTQPIRIGDIVTLENETGTIHEIASTYAIVQTWDQRSLIVPLTYFTEKMFQNLTLASSELLGTVSFFVDYSVPIGEVREELKRILQESSSWDRRSWALSVADLKENSVQLTALMSASDSANLGMLRSEIRENLLSFIQKKFPRGLPRFRAELDIGRNDGGDGRGVVPSPQREAKKERESGVQ